jgi:hypothetical protein
MSIILGKYIGLIFENPVKEVRFVLFIGPSEPRHDATAQVPDRYYPRLSKVSMPKMDIGAGVNRFCRATLGD